MTLEERIEAAASALTQKSGYRNFSDLPRHRRESVLDDVRIVLGIVCPGLADDPPKAWLAPWEADEGMKGAGRDAIHLHMTETRTCANAVFAAMRDFHTSREK